MSNINIRDPKGGLAPTEDHKGMLGILNVKIHGRDPKRYGMSRSHMNRNIGIVHSTFEGLPVISEELASGR